MTRSIILAVSVLSLLVGSGCLWGSGDYKAPAAITGYVYEDDTGEPIPGALVVLMPSNASLRTGPDGSYRFDNLPRGKYTVRASATGFQDAEKRGVEAVPGKVGWAKLFLERQPEPSPDDAGEK